MKDLERISGKTEQMKMQTDVVPPSSQVTPQAQFVTITEEEAGQRIDNYLLRVCKGVPKSHVYRILRSGQQIDVTIPEISDGKKTVTVNVSAPRLTSRRVGWPGRCWIHRSA